MTDPFAAIRGKCVWWREIPNDEDRYSTDVKPAQKRIECSCFIEGYGWTFETAEVPPECPRERGCRYFVKGY
jgi:hypothetical protein